MLWTSCEDVKIDGVLSCLYIPLLIFQADGNRKQSSSRFILLQTEPDSYLDLSTIFVEFR